MLNGHWPHGKYTWNWDPNEKVLNVKAVVDAFNQEKALVGAFPVIVKTDCEIDGSFSALDTSAISGPVSTHVTLTLH